MLRFRDLAVCAGAASLSACGAGPRDDTLVPALSRGAALVERTGEGVAAASAHAAYAFVDLGGGPGGGSALTEGANKTFVGGNYVAGHGSCGKDCSFNIYHAVAWSGPGSTPADISPPLPYFAMARVYGGAASLLVGSGIVDAGGYYGNTHALVWRGSALKWTDINPSGDTTSYAWGTNGSEIVGSGGSGSSHALLWSLASLTTPVDLHPGASYTASEAFATQGNSEVGYAIASATATQHAMLWNGSAASAVDLTPSGVTSAYAYGVDKLLQAGCGVPAPATASHALLWHGSAATMRDLNPAGFTDSCARAVRGGVEAGYGHVGGADHAVVWTGSAKSAVDLQLALPSAYAQSQAYAFDPSGNIVGAVLTSSGWHGAMWLRQ